MSIVPTCCHYINQYFDVLHQSYDNLVHIYNRYVDSPLQQSIQHEDSINTVGELQKYQHIIDLNNYLHFSTSDLPCHFITICLLTGELYLKPTFNYITVLFIDRRTIFISNLPCDFIKVAFINTRTMFTSNQPCNSITVLLINPRTMFTSNLACNSIKVQLINTRTIFTSNLPCHFITVFVIDRRTIFTSNITCHFITVLFINRRTISTSPIKEIKILFYFGRIQ